MCLGSLRNTTNILNNLKTSADNVVENAKNPKPIENAPATSSASKLEDPGLMERVIENGGGGVSSYSPSDGGLKLKLGAGVTNLPFVDLIEGSKEINNLDNPFKSKLAKDYDPSLGVNAELRVDRERWGLGLKIDTAANINTTGIKQNSNEFAGIFDQAKSLETKLGGLQNQVNGLKNKLENNQTFKQAEALINQIKNNPALANAQTLDKLKGLLNNNELKQIFSELQSTLKNFNSSVNDASTALAMIGDKTRIITAEAALRGAAEVNAAYRTERHKIGNGWGIRGGIEMAAIVPMPNPVNTPNEMGLPQFKSLMSKVSTNVKVTTNGLENLNNRINSLQSNFSELESSIGKAGNSVSKVGKSVSNIDPKNPLSIISQAGNIKNNLNELKNTSKETTENIKNLDKNLQNLSSDLNNVKVDTSVGMTAVSATDKVGFGVKDIGVTLDGPIGKDSKLSFSTGLMNPVGYIGGNRSTYELAKEVDDYNFKQLSSVNKNVFHDFYDPTLYGSVGLKFNDSTWYKTQIDARVEKSLSSDTIRAAGITKQSIGFVSLKGGVMSTDLKEGAKNLTYMGGVGIGSIKNPDIFSVNAAVNSTDSSKINNASVQAEIKVPF